jgi:hypothetical protein
MGTVPAYMIASALFRLFHPPMLVGSAAMLWGYFRSAMQRKPRYGDEQFRRFLREYQRKCLLRGKRRATAEINARQKAAWRAPATASLAGA